MAKVKLFTIDEAEKTLPLVRRVVGDIVKAFDAREKSLLERQKLPLSPNPGSSIEEKALALERDMEHYEDEIKRFIGELERVGVELKDFRTGLIDFFSRYDGRIVYLCWKMDEGNTLGWWHELNGGFRGRQPITQVNRTKFRGLDAGESFVELREG